MQTPSLGVNRYAVVYVDDYSRKRFVYFMKSRDELLRTFKECVAEFEARGVHIKRLHSDNGGEYMSKEMAYYCLDKGIKQTTSAPYSPAQNAVAEVSWRLTCNMARSMMISAGLWTTLWSYAVRAAVYLLDRTSTSSNQRRTPIELWTGKAPSLTNLRILGC